MKIRKIITSALTLALTAAVFAGCGNTAASGSGNSAATKSNTAAASTETKAAADDTIKIGVSISTSLVGICLKASYPSITATSLTRTRILRFPAS